MTSVLDENGERLLPNRVHSKHHLTHAFLHIWKRIFNKFCALYILYCIELLYVVSKVFVFVQNFTAILEINSYATLGISHSRYSLISQYYRDKCTSAWYILHPARPCMSHYSLMHKSIGSRSPAPLPSADHLQFETCFIRAVWKSECHFLSRDSYWIISYRTVPYLGVSECIAYASDSSLCGNFTAHLRIRIVLCCHYLSLMHNMR